MAKLFCLLSNCVLQLTRADAGLVNCCCQLCLSYTGQCHSGKCRSAGSGAQVCSRCSCWPLYPFCPEVTCCTAFHLNCLLPNAESWHVIYDSLQSYPCFLWWMKQSRNFVLSLFTLLTLHYDLFWWLCCCCCSCSWLWFPNNLGFVCFVSFVYLQRCYKTRVWISREETQQNPPAGCEIWSSLPIVKSSQTSLGWPDA